MTNSEFDLSILKELTSAYDATIVEDPIYAFWEDNGWFRPADAGEGDAEPFTVIMPPPNVTGVLHLGHAVTMTIEDALIRWRRMLGQPTLWLPGFDHAGIATQSVVEQQLAREGVTRHDLGREAFEQRVWDWVGVTRPRITAQARRIGASCDWERTAFTLDPVPQAAVRKTFVDLHKDGMIYHGARIINWDPQMLTALSDVEVEYEQEAGKLWHIRYPFVDERGNELDDGVTIATTRPETIPADVAIAVHPDDERWRPHLGRRVRVPLRGFNRLIPLIADSAVDLEFGTGALKITPGHDQLDFEIGERHGLDPIRVVDWDGTLTAEAGLYAGMDRDGARALVAQHLDEDGYLIQTEAHVHNVGHSQRSGVVVEPLVSNQWFVDTTELADEAARVVRDGDVRIVPERSTAVYLQWMDNIRPWCISRQLWWGHRIPAWYCASCDADAIIRGDDGQITIDEGSHPIVELDDPASCPTCGGSDLVQDPDVLDTWFSSGLWTHSTLGWPDTTDDLNRFYPSSVMETGYDILFFWVARMIMLGCYNMGRPPFQTVYLHGLVRDAQGRKMSKSLDNVIDPLAKADQYGMDALRFTLATGSTPGNDMRLTDERLEGSRNFANKLWNGAKFVLGELSRSDHIASPWEVSPAGTPPLEDRWILSRLQAVTDAVDELLRQFQLGEAGRQIQDFLWGECFDWYVEASKVRLRQGDASPLSVLVAVLDGGLRLLHPWMPFITEAIWQQLRPHLVDAQTTALISARYPQPGDREHDLAAETAFAAVQEIVTAVRQIRADYRVQAGQWAEAYMLPQPDAAEAVAACQPIIEALARVRPLTIVSERSDAPGEQIASAVLSSTEIILPLGGLIDVEHEHARLSKDLESVVNRLRGTEAKLANEGFRAKAPPHIVRQAESLAADLQRQRADLESRIGTL